MASMRVHELAKEFDMSSKELLDKLQQMKIPAKSHASMLADAYVDKIRKNLEPEIKQRAGQLEDEEARKLAEERAEAERKKLADDLAYYEGFLASVMKKLSNERFVASAPEKVVANERAKQADAEAKITAIREQLAALESGK